MLSNDSAVLVAVVCGVASLSGLAMIFAGEVVYGACVVVASGISMGIAMAGRKKR